MVTALIEFYAEFTHQRHVMFFTKPLLLPLIALYYFFSAKNSWNKVHSIMLFAFLFSWFGDISLMLTPETLSDTELMGIPKSKYFFLAGLSSFFVTQVLFISVYRKTVSAEKIHFVNRFWYLPFVVYWLMILFVILPPLNANKEKSAAVIPVIFYSAVLMVMAATALARYKKTNANSFWLTFIGACAFVISDSLIAINFLALQQPTYYAGFSIITSYVIAEYLIAEGILKHQLE